MIVRRCRSEHFFRMTFTALCFMVVYLPLAASQETKEEAALSCSSSNAAFVCPSAAARKEIPKTQDQLAANLPDAPQTQDQSNPPSSSSQPQDQNSALLFLPVKSPRSPSFGNKFTIYAHQAFGPPAVIFPAFGAGMAMANPKKNYPREWKDGAGAFGRQYGDSNFPANSALFDRSCLA
jgi:hypothetical protein